MLINTLTLQEVKDSSEVENIVTTHDELFKADLFEDYIKSPAAKEVQDYSTALRKGFAQVKKTKLIRLTDILEIQETLEKNRAGLRKLPGTDLKNTKTGGAIYTPPQNSQEVESLIENLVIYINDKNISELDVLVRMAVIHFQFESIHPFYDGNGRTGRIINILHLVANDLLDMPILYLSRYIIKNKDAYYKTLQNVRDINDWESWLLFILEGIEQTSRQTIELIHKTRELMMNYKHRIRSELSKIYRQDLLNNLFKHPYTKIDYVMNDLNVSRITATRYLDELSKKEFLKKRKVGRNNYYINNPLCKILTSGM